MKRYLLLRNNRESGPYLLDEIIAQELVPLDLIWVEGGSNSWRYPTEIDELSPYVQKEMPVTGRVSKRPAAAPPSESPRRIYVALPEAVEETAAARAAAPAAPEALQVKYTQSLDEIKDMYVDHLRSQKFRFGKRFSRPGALWLAALFAGLLLGAFAMKQLVENFGSETGMDTGAEEAPVYSILPEKPRPALELSAPPEANQPAVAASKPDKKAAVNLYKLVQVQASAYKAGAFGGISELKFTVNNRSDLPLEAIQVEVQYLKPNGEAVRTKTYTFSSVAPRSVQHFEVPPSTRGVKIQYKVTGLQAKQAPARLREA